MTHTLVVATRRSLLALTQTRAFVSDFKRMHPGFEVEELLNLESRVHAFEVPWIRG